MEDMNTYRVLLTDCLILDRTFVLRLMKEIQLPFVPSRSISLGLDKDSWFNEDMLRVERVMYRTTDDLFLVELRESRWVKSDEGYFWEVVESYAENGWRLMLRLPFESLEDLDLEWLDEAPDRDIVFVRGGYHHVSKPDIRVLEMTGEAYRIIPRSEFAPVKS